VATYTKRDVVSDDAERTVYEVAGKSDDGAAFVGFESVPKKPDPLSALQQKAEQAIGNLEAAEANWASLSAAQKDAANKLAVQVTAHLARIAAGRFER
jgi:hypothetical protein